MLQILFCNSEAGLRIMGFMGILISIIKIVVPIILIVVGTISLVKCIVSNNNDETKKEISKLVKKMILSIVIFLLPSIVMFLINVVTDNSDGKKCMSCLLDSATDCMDEANDLKSGKATGFCSPYDGDPDKCTEPCEYSDGACNEQGY